MIRIEELQKRAIKIKTEAYIIRKSKLIQQWFEDALKLETEDCVIWPFADDGKGYGLIRIKGKLTRVHIETAKRKFGICPIGKETAHGPCHNRSCFNYKHLSYKTYKENKEDMIRDGTQTYGEAHHGARYSDETIRNIKADLAKGIKRRIISEKYNISVDYLSQISLGKYREEIK